MPVELLSSILKYFDSPQDLISVIIASPACRSTFKASPTLFLTSLMLNAIEPCALPHALATLAVFPFITANTFPENVDRFIGEYIGTCYFGFPDNVPGLTALCRLYSSASFFVNDYSVRAQQALGSTLPAETILPLSSFERARFQRAFFRYEIYCVIARHRNMRNGSSNPFFDSDTQLYRFLALLTVEEVEEMSCVHFYFTSKMGDFVKDLEDQFVADALAAAADSGRPQPSATTSRGTGAKHADGTVGFDDMESTNLHFYSEKGTIRINDTIKYFAALGSLTLYYVIIANDHRQRNMIRRFDYSLRTFLPEALDAAVAAEIVPNEDFEGTNRTSAQAIITETACGINSGILIFSFLGRNLYLPISPGSSLCGLREMGFVFWDSERFEVPWISRNVQEAAQMSDEVALQLYDQSNRESVEKRLAGVKVTRTQMKKLMEQYGTPGRFEAYDDHLG